MKQLVSAVCDVSGTHTQVRQPLADTFWGDRHAQLADPFGRRWNISQHVRDVPHDEVVAAAARVFG